MEFFVAGGDAAVGFEASEEIFDFVALAIEMLVKGWFSHTIVPRGYDGDAAELVHISADRVAIVSLVHDSAARRAQVFMQKGLSLIEVCYVGSSKDEPEWIAEGIAGKVDLG